MSRRCRKPEETKVRLSRHGFSLRTPSSYLNIDAIVGDQFDFLDEPLRLRLRIRLVRDVNFEIFTSTDSNVLNAVHIEKRRFFYSPKAMKVRRVSYESLTWLILDREHVRGSTRFAGSESVDGPNAKCNLTAFLEIRHGVRMISSG